MDRQQRQIAEGSIWRHHSGKTYRVLALANSEANGALYVVYTMADGTGPTWTRPLGDFLGLTQDGQFRFLEIGGPVPPNDPARAVLAELVAAWNGEHTAGVNELLERAARVLR